MILIVGILAGLITYVLTPLVKPAQVRLATTVYYFAVRSLIAGEGLYHVSPPGLNGYYFLYPPITVLFFSPLAVLPSANVAYAVQTLLNLLAATGTGGLIIFGLANRGIILNRVDRMLVIGFLIFSSYSAIQFLNGQINLLLGWAFAFAFIALETSRERLAGILFAMASLFKLFPAVIGLWLVRARATKAVKVAVVTGLGSLLLGTILFGAEVHFTYVVDVLGDRFAGATYTGRPAPTATVGGVHRQLATVWPTGTRFHSVGGMLLVGIPVGISLSTMDTQLRRDLASLATIVGILLFMPLQPLYFPLITYPLFMVLYQGSTDQLSILIPIGMLLTFMHVDFSTVQLVIGLLDLPPSAQHVVLDSFRPVFTFILPPTAGLWLLLFGCTVAQLRHTAAVGSWKS